MVYPINEYDIIGSGLGFAEMAIGLINEYLTSIDERQISDLTVEMNVGIVAHLISESKKYDLFSGGNTQIGIIDNNGFKGIIFDNHPEYYHTAVKEMAKFLKKDENEVKKLLPVNITKLLE